ncbi:MAG: Ig-like domain-containing protein [Clostridia bacterium]|nr:Ig-like domain-containing protein [Clostridia bacterium]
MKKISITLIIALLFTMMPIISPVSYATTTETFSTITIASGMNFPIGVIQGPDGKLYVSEYIGNKIHKMDTDGSNKTTFDSGFNQPIGLVFDSAGNLLIAEHAGRAVKKMSPEGVVTTVKSGFPGLLTGIALDSSGRIYTVDYTTGAIYRMDPDGSHMTTLGSVSTSGGIGIAIDGADNVYVSDQRVSKVVKFTPDGTKSDFASVSWTPYVAIGADGYLYAPTNNHTIEKYNLDGTHVKSFAFADHSIWGIYADSNGGIYFIDNVQGTLNKLLAYANVIDQTHVTITMMYDLVDTSADPNAFTLTGIASNPNIVSAVATDSKIELILDDTIEFTDTSIKVSYTPSGTNDLIQENTMNPLAAFSNLAVKNPMVGINSVSALSNINVDNATALNAVGLPTSVQVSLSNGTTSNVSISAWDNGSPTYNPTQAGTYTFKGTLSLDASIHNPENKQATVNVIVAEPVLPIVTTAGATQVISVPNGTDLSEVNLPTTVSIGLNDSTTTNVSVSWDGGTPPYDGDTAGTYAFSGTLASSANYLNPSNIKASLNVVVSAEPALPEVTTAAATQIINVANGTSLNDINLPTTTQIYLSNATTSTAGVVWDGGTPPYDGDTAGTYAFSGTIATSSTYLNPNNIKASISVVVAEKPTVTSVDTIAPILVSNGTSFSAINLPTSVSVTLSDSSTTNATIESWNTGSSTYNATQAGSYVLSGTLASSSNYLNPANSKASLELIVLAPESTSSSSSRKDKDSGSSNSSASQSSDTLKESGSVLVNGVEKNVSDENRITENGKSKVEVTIDEASLEKVIVDLISKKSPLDSGEKNLVKINVQDTSGDTTVVGLNGEIVKQMDEDDFDILVDAGERTYKIPAKQLSVDEVAKNLNVDQANLKSIQFEIQFDKVADADQTAFTQKLVENKAKIVIQPTEFKISALVTKTDGSSKTMDIDTFGEYVTRGIELPSGINIDDITTGIVFDKNYGYSQVPTFIYTENGKNYARINSLTNSVYSVISNPVEVSAVQGHWSEPIVNDMASRLILTDYADFDADKNVTRGELVAYMVNALGIYRDDAPVDMTFTDVDPSNPDARAIALASQWGLINGYADGSFKANAEITREEAMIIFARAMSIAQYETIADGSPVEKVLSGKIFVGRSESDLGLKENLTHAESLTALHNLLVKAELINE